MGFSLADILGGGGAMAGGPLGYFAGSAIGGRSPQEATGVLSDGYNAMSGKKGLDTAAAGAREAQAQANALAQLQWQRQMQGLQEARGQTQPYLSLYDKIYGTQTAGRMTPVGGMAPGMDGGPRSAQPDRGASPAATPFRSLGVDINKPVGSAWDMINKGVASVANSQPAQAPIMRGTPPTSPPQAPGSNMTPRIPQQGSQTWQQLLAGMLGSRG
jgi:hypothetical protein